VYNKSDPKIHFLSLTILILGFVGLSVLLTWAQIENIGETTQVLSRQELTKQAGVSASSSDSIQIEVETPEGFKPVDYSIIPTINPEIRITIPPDIPMARVYVFLDDSDESTPPQDITELFYYLLTDRTDTATVNTTIGNNTLKVIAMEGDNVTAESATMLNFSTDTLATSSPKSFPLIIDPETLLEYEDSVLVLKFTKNSSLVEISNFLRQNALMPLDFAVPTSIVRAQITTGESPFYLTQQLSTYPLLEAVLPNFTVELPDVTGEEIPERLRNTYRARAHSGCTAPGPNDRLTGCFDYDGNNVDELRIFRHHFLMDTFAAHRLVNRIVGNAPAQQVGLSNVDSGLGNGANTTDIPNAALFGYSRSPFTCNNTGIQIDAFGNPTNFGIADVRDLFPGGHGTPVTAAAAGRGVQVLGTGKDLRVRPIRYRRVNAAGQNVTTWNDVGMAITCAAFDSNIQVLNLEAWNRLDQDGNGVVTPQERLNSTNGANWLRGQLRASIELASRPFMDYGRDGNVGIVDADGSQGNGTYELGEPFCDTNGNGIFDGSLDGKIIVTAMGNDREDRDDEEFPSDFAPIARRTNNDLLVMAVSATKTEDRVREPELLARFSNFGTHNSVAALGEQVILPDPAGNLQSFSGTSFSTPQVSGLAGEMIFLDRNMPDRHGQPFLTPLQIIEIIEATSEDLGSTINAANREKPNDQPGDGLDIIFGHGRVSVWKAILAVANHRIAVESHRAGGRSPATDFPSLSTIDDVNTQWYGFRIITSVFGATAWVGQQLDETAAILPNPGTGDVAGGTTAHITAYKGVPSDKIVLLGIDQNNDRILDEDPTSGVVPIGNNGGEYIMTFSIKRSDLIDAEGKPRVLSLRKPGQDADDPPYYNLRLELQMMRNGEVPGVVFDDFVFEITPTDFGDARDRPYDSLLRRNGARSLNTNLEWFGKPNKTNVESVSPEPDASTEDNAPDAHIDPDGVMNIYWSPDLDRYDDGVVFYPLTYIPGGKGKVKFTVCVANMGDPARNMEGRYRAPGAVEADEDRSLYVNAWIDWNSNGTWETYTWGFPINKHKEYIIDGLRIDPSADFKLKQLPTNSILTPATVEGNCGTFEAEFDVPEIGLGEIWARFRLDYGENVSQNDPTPLFTSDSSLRYDSGPTRFGEVEDYLIGSDFGDALDPFTAEGKYPTLKREHQGARHLDIYKEWLGETKVPSVSREVDANDTKTDQDRPISNLNPENTDKFDDGVILPPVFQTGVPAVIKVKVHSTIFSRGFESNGEDFQTLGTDCKPHWVNAPPETPKVSKGKGRYAHFVKQKRLFLNMWVDWNCNGEWEEGERICCDAPIDPVTFGKDEQYTLGEQFEDKNKDGVWQSDEPFTDWAGVESKEFTCTVIPPIICPNNPNKKFYVRARLNYGEDKTTDTSVIANVDEEGRILDGPKGGALFGEVEDYPMMGRKSGRKWKDMNGNGIWDYYYYGGGSYYEPSISGATIILKSESGEELASTTTDGDGYYEFNGLSPGTYVVQQAPRPGWIPTWPWSGKYTFTITEDQLIHENNNFGDTMPGKIGGRKWQDRNGNGIWDITELPLSGWEIVLKKGGNIVGTTTTDALGNYQFSNLLPGEYIIEEVHKNGWEQTFPGGAGNHSITTYSGENTFTYHFGNRRNWLRGIITGGGGGHYNPGEKGLTLPIPSTGHLKINLRNNTDSITSYHYHIEWINQPADVTYSNSTLTSPYPQLQPQGEDNMTIVFHVGERALPGRYQFIIIIMDQYGYEYEVDPYLILIGPTGYNTYWIIFTAISLMLAGGLLFIRKRKKFATQINDSWKG